MVLPGPNEEGPAGGEHVRCLRNRDIPLDVRQGREASHRASSVNSQEYHGARSAHGLTGSQLQSHGEAASEPSSRGGTHSMGRGSPRSQATQRSQRSQAEYDLEEMEAEVHHRRRMRELQLEELREQHELEKARRALRRANGSQVSRTPSLVDIGVSPRVRVDSWMAEEINTVGPPAIPMARSAADRTEEARPLGPSVTSVVLPVSDRVEATSAPCEPLMIRQATQTSPDSFRENLPANNCLDQGDTGQHTYWARKTLGKSLPSFSGDPGEWLNFIAAYHRTTSICGFSEEENVARLDKALLGKARESVNALLALPNAANEIIRMLELQFGKPTLIVYNLAEKIRKFPRVSEESPQSLIDFSVKVNNLVVSIQCMGQERLLSYQLLQEAISKLSPTLKLQWGEFATISLGDEADLRDLRKWLLVKAEAASCINIQDRFSNHRSDDKRQVSVISKSENVNRLTAKEPHCFYCKCKHLIGDCEEFRCVLVDDRRAWVRDNGLCFSCLRKDHRAKRCRSAKPCGVGGCQGKHHELLHPGARGDPVAAGSEPHVITHSIAATPKVLLKILPVRIRGPVGCQVVSALLDEGADCSLIDQDLALSLGIRGRSEPLCIQWIQDVSRRDEDSEAVTLSVSSAEGGRTYTLSRVRTVKGLSLPEQNVAYNELTRVWPPASRVVTKNQGPAKILIGQDNWSLIQPIRCLKQGWNGLVLSQTRLGWVLHGKIDSANSSPDNFHPLHVCQVEKPEDTLHNLVKEYFSLDFLPGRERGRSLSADDVRAVQVLESTAKIVEGRWEVGLLWACDQGSSVDSRPNALRRLFCVEKKLDRDPKFAEQYIAKISDYVNKGYARKLTREEFPNPKRVWYLPHLAVFNPNKPGKIRVVFDASAKVEGVSLNSQLLKGPDLYNSIPHLLMRFRKGKVAFGGDIREMYLRIRIRNEDTNAQRFLWRGMDRNRIPEVFVMESMLFGAISSPFEAQEIRNRNASRYASSHPKAVEAIHNAHYMDDYLDSADTEEEAIQMIRDVVLIHRQGGFEMVNWVSNSLSVLREVNSIMNDPADCKLDSNHAEKVLGLRWDPKNDTFIFRFNSSRIPEPVRSGLCRPTKREFLRVVMSVFDPLGFLGWFMVNAKILLQDIWRTKCEWDEEIDPKFKPRWDSWLTGLSRIEKIEIPRCYTPLSLTASSIELHIFCDASDRAYAALAYIRVSVGERVEISLIAARTRVAPLRQISVPRLELQAAVMGCRLAENLSRGSGLNFSKTVFWSDSKTVLHWIIHSEARYRMFIAHRLGEILESSKPSQWRWVSGRENPADYITKGQIEMPGVWLRGPDFLKYKGEYWPRADDLFTYIDDGEVLERLNLVITCDRIESALPDAHRFSKLLKLLRATAWLLRFISRSRGRNFPGEGLVLAPEEVQSAEELWWKSSQKLDFAQEIADLRQGKYVCRRSRLYRLSPYLDQAGILRVRGRIDRARDVPYELKRPVILDPRNRFTVLLVDHYHWNAGHQGQEFVANELRQKYWVLGLRRAVKRSWSRCLVCARNRAKPLQQPMAPLPMERLNHHSRPFTSVGLDYFGPLYVTVRRSREKRYGAIFSCLTTRAVHLEVVKDLTADGTLLAVRRMASRRGCPTVIWSDNGTNFRSADKVIRECLQKMDQYRMEEELAKRNIKWNFLPPAAPHMGGSWERLIWSVKRALLATMTSVAPQEDVLTTLLTEAECLVNSRPLTTVSEDTSDLEALTPNHFLIGSSSGAVTWLKEDRSLDLRKKWQLAQRLTDLFWRRWLKEFLPGLIKKTKWFGQAEPIKIGDVVFLADGKSSRKEWLPGRIVATYPGRDGVTRVADVKTKSGVVRRSVSSLLPIQARLSSDSRAATGGGGCSPLR